MIRRQTMPPIRRTITYLVAALILAVVLNAPEAADSMARDLGIRAGLFQAITIWPFPKQALQERFRRIKKVLTVELSMGQMKYEIERAAFDDVDTRTLLRASGVPFSPEDILDRLREF
jgi:2-oxoglutarate ferredoxin oxidoreductase subunit alpha